jgi:hypothetical protein
MDKILMQLRGQGHLVGNTYEQDGHMWVIVDAVAMTHREATAVAEKRATVQQVVRSRAAKT